MDARRRWAASGIDHYTMTYVPPERYGTSVTAEVEGLEVRRPDGSAVLVGDVRIVNDCWGCFAG